MRAFNIASASTRRPSCNAATAARRLAAALVALPLLAGPALAFPAARDATGTLPFAAAPLPDEELAGLRGGFSIGGFGLSVGIVSRSVLGQTDGVGERLEVVSRYSVPDVGRLSYDGTTVRSLPVGGDDGPAAPGQPGPGILVSTFGAGATVDLGGTTRLTHRLLDTFVENSDVNRALARQLDINLGVRGLPQRLQAATAARALRPAVEAQLLYGRR